MATVAIPTDVTRWIDDYLSYLNDALDDLIDIDREWDTWDDLSQLTFVVEWPIKVDRFGQLKAWAGEGLLSDEQEARYRKLLALAEQRQPILDRLLAD